MHLNPLKTINIVSYSKLSKPQSGWTDFYAYQSYTGVTILIAISGIRRSQDISNAYAGVVLKHNRMPGCKFTTANLFRVNYLAFCYIFYASSSVATEPIDYQI